MEKETTFQYLEVRCAECGKTIPPQVGHFGEQEGKFYTAHCLDCHERTLKQLQKRREDPPSGADYRVNWAVDVTAENPRQAAEMAEEIQRSQVTGSHGASPGVFWVAKAGEDSIESHIDLSEPQTTSALQVLKEFIADVEAVGYEHVCEDWPDLSITYRKAKKAAETVQITAKPQTITV